MKWKLLALSSLFVLGQSVNAYDVVNRFRLIDDKLKTEQMLRPIGHDFFIDMGAAANKNVTDFIDDVKNATDYNGPDELGNAQAVLAKWDETEQTVKINIGLGFPLPSFSAFDVAFKPNFRVLVDVGANIGIRSEQVTLADVLDYFPEEIPADLRTFILGLSVGEDVIVECTGAAGAGLSAETRAFCATQPTGRYIIPDTTQELPLAAVYGKADAKAGFFNDYTYGEHWFGQFNLYGMGRADLFQIVTAQQIASGQGVEAPDKMNTEVTVQTDYRLGYKNTNYSAFLGVEEIKLATMKEREEGSKEQTYGYDPLIRFHADAKYRYLALSLQPFVGVHKRSGYGFSDGMYGGVAAGAFVWGDRLGLQMTGMFDKQYFTLTPRVKLWLMQLEYSLKKPMKDTADDVKLTTIHSLDFRLFF